MHVCVYMYMYIYICNVTVGSWVRGAGSIHGHEKSELAMDICIDKAQLRRVGAKYMMST